MSTTEDNSNSGAGQVKRPVRPRLREREAADLYAELRAMGYTWIQAHETMDRIAAERERCKRAVYNATDWAHDERDFVLKEAIVEWIDKGPNG